MCIRLNHSISVKTLFLNANNPNPFPNLKPCTIQMEEMASLQNVLGDETKKQMQLLTDMSEGKVNATESGEMLAQFLREQLEKVEATKELVDRSDVFCF